MSVAKMGPFGSVLMLILRPSSRWIYKPSVVSLYMKISRGRECSNASGTAICSTRIPRFFIMRKKSASTRDILGSWLSHISTPTLLSPLSPLLSYMYLLALSCFRIASYVSARAEYAPEFDGKHRSLPTTISKGNSFSFSSFLDASSVCVASLPHDNSATLTLPSVTSSFFSTFLCNNGNAMPRSVTTTSVAPMAARAIPTNPRPAPSSNTVLSVRSSTSA
mmetsp:Transcript_32210/g.94832  ORF Transcript_32210/g.94832 Transcript_32210/m.94832 type:complete len:221 (-) Transcript_32210:97-759(-)